MFVQLNQFKFYVTGRFKLVLLMSLCVACFVACFSIVLPYVYLDDFKEAEGPCFVVRTDH